MEKEHDILRDGLIVRVEFFRPSGKWYAGGSVNVGNSRMYDRQEFMQAIIDNQAIMSGKNWLGEYDVFVEDLPENFKLPEYREFSRVIYRAEHWIPFIEHNSI